MNVTQSDIEQKTKEIKFTVPENWITSETRMMKRADHIQSELVELYRRCMMIITETELLREGIEQVAQTVPTYEVLSSSTETEEEKPEFIEDLEQEEEEIKEDEKESETNNRMSS